MEAVANAWETVDWERLQTKIEAEIEALGVRQDDSEERRKRLVEESNGYRERTNKETRKVAVPLIKAFQQEFDGLIARSQLAESALIDICSQITNLPDPKSLLKGAEAWKSDADKTKRAVEEREQLKKKLQETQNELAELKNSDAEVQKLKTKLTKQEIEHEKLIDDAIDQAERRIRDELDQRLDEMSMKNERQRLENEQLEKKLAEMETKHREVGRKLDVAKIINNQKESLDDEQLQIAVKDLNDANHRIVVLEEKIAELTSELDIAMSSNQIGQPKSNGITDLAAFGELMIEKDEQIKKMNEEMTEMERRNGEEMKKWKEKVANLEKDQKRQNAQIEELKGQLEARQDYEAIKKELRLLREIEFGESLDSNADNQISVDSVETLDKLLAEKNRRLQNEKANLRVMNEGFKASLEDNQRVIVSLKTRAESAEKLVANLEDDLATALGGVIEQTTEKMSTLDMLRTSAGHEASAGSAGTSEKSGNEASLIPILTSQRNRLHEKVTNLEEMLALEKTKQLSVQTEIERVREDNVKLYEKVRFLQRGFNSQTARVTIEEDVMNNGKLSTRNRGMQLHDRATLNMGRAILASSKNRMIFFFYLLILHVLIMLVLYKFAFEQATLRDQQTECEYKFLQHMKESHKEH